MNIYLFCNAGMSTSILEKAIKKEMESRGIEGECKAYDVTKIKKVVSDGDIILLGPQIGHQFKKITESMPNNKVYLLSMMEFGRMDAKGILNRIL